MKQTAKKRKDALRGHTERQVHTERNDQGKEIVRQGPSRDVENRVAKERSLHSLHWSGHNDKGTTIAQEHSTLKEANISGNSRLDTGK